MEPISVILAALVAGASSALKDTAGQAIRDAYEGLRSLIKRRLGGNDTVEAVLDKHEAAPDVWQRPLEQQLRESGVADDEAVLKKAQELLMAPEQPTGETALRATGG